MSLITDYQTAMESNRTAIKEYTARLAEDALNPKKDYSLDGETMDRSKWRKTIADMIKELTETNMLLQQAINQQQPYFIATRHVV